MYIIVQALSITAIYMLIKQTRSRSDTMIVIYYYNAANHIKCIRVALRAIRVLLRVIN